MAAKKTKKPAKKPAKKASPAKKAKKSAPAKKAAPSAAKPKMAAASAARTYSFSPLDDRILVAIDRAEDKTSGGLFIPDSAKGLSVRGTVVAVGRGHRNKKGQLRPLDVQVGDRVMFSEYAGTKVTLGSGEALILREVDILGVEI